MESEVLVAIASLALIVFIVWWFFGKHDSGEVEASLVNGEQDVQVTVDGGYTPNTVVLQQGSAATITFNRQDASSCFNQVVFPDFGIREDLPVGEDHPIVIDTSKPGEYSYACGMNMFHGKVVIK